jgi:hypothetical protein
MKIKARVRSNISCNYERSFFFTDFMREETKGKVITFTPVQMYGTIMYTCKETGPCKYYADWLMFSKYSNEEEI